MLNSHCLVEEFIIGRLLFLYLFTIGLPKKVVRKKCCVCLGVIEVLTQSRGRRVAIFLEVRMYKEKENKRRLEVPFSGRGV